MSITEKETGNPSKKGDRKGKRNKKEKNKKKQKTRTLTTGWGCWALAPTAN